MAVITASIGTAGGRTYSTVQLWEDALPADLVSDGNARVGECYNDGGAALGRVSISAHTTNSTNYLKLTAAAGQSFMDNANVRTTALAFASSTYAALRTTTGYTFCVDLTGAVDYFTCDRLMLESTVGSSAPFTAVSGCDHNLWKNLICSSANTSTNVGEIYGNSTLLVNIAFYQNSGSGAPITFRNDPTLIGCTFVRTTNNGTTGTGPTARNYSTPKMISCAVFGYSTVVGTVGAGAWSASSKNNATQAASGLPGSSNQHSVTFNATTPFTQASATSTDLRAVASTSLASNGFLDATNAPNDISGTARASSPTIGAWELTAAGGGAPVLVLEIWAPPRGVERPQPPQQYFWVEPAAVAVAPPTLPLPQPVPARRPSPPPDVFAWVEPLPVPPVFGQSATLQRRPSAPPPGVETGPSRPLLGELPLPPTSAPVIPRRPAGQPPDQQIWPGLSLLDPHIEDFPILPWTAATTRPQEGAWRPVGVAEGQIPPTAPTEPPPGRAVLGRGRAVTPRQNASWDLFWTPPDVVQALPPGAAEGGVPGRANLGTRAGVYAAVAQALLGELPPGRAAAARVPTRISPPVGSSGSTLLLFSVVVPPPAGAASAPVPGVPTRRGRTVVWSWGGYIPPPATPLPPGVQRGPFAGHGHGHAPVSPYGAAYVLSIPPALFGVAELWQFPGGLSMYTFGGDDAAAWEFQAPSTIWEW